MSMSGRKKLLLSLNLVPVGFSLYFVRRYYGEQVAFDLFTWRNLAFFLGLVLVSACGYSNSIWRYIMTIKRQGGVVDERLVSERLMYINLISFFFPFGVLNYAAQLALVYRANPAKLVGMSFFTDKLMFLGVIVVCFLATFAGLTPGLAASLGIPVTMVHLALALNVLFALALLAYLARGRYLRFFLVQLLVFIGINAATTALLVSYAGMGWAAFAIFLQKLFAYCLAVTLPVSMGGVGPRELVLLFQVEDPVLRTTILNFCVIWFVALLGAAILLFVAKKPLSALAARCYQRWRRPPRELDRLKATIGAASEASETHNP